MKLKNLWLIAVAILIYACNAEETRSWEVTFDPNKPKDPNEQSIINVAAGKFYKMNVVANSAYADKAPLDPWTSGTKLTDEETGTLSTKNRGVGWNAQTVEVIIDLGSLRSITEVSVHAISDPTSQIVFPAQIEVSTSKDKSQWEKAASPISYSDSNGKSDAWGKTDFSNVACRYVKATLKSSASTSTMMLIDEIKVMGEFHNDMKYVPEKGCYHGAFPPLYGFDPEDREGSTDQCAVALFEKLVGKQLSMILWYQNMEPGRNFSEMQTVREKYWGKNYQGKYRFFLYGWLPVIPTQQMANGELDDFHKSYFAEVAAQQVRDMGPIWFRPANEMNGSWTPYYGDPTNYVKAWRRMYNIAEQLGVTAYNVFVWSPNSVSMPGTEANAMKNYYPGDMYVDWLGVSCYPPSLSATYPEERRYPLTLMQGIKQVSADKPIMISEGGYSSTCDHQRWVREWFKLKDEEPRVKAVVWENHENAENGDRRLQSDPLALELYKELVQDPYWLDLIPDAVYSEIETRKNNSK